MRKNTRCGTQSCTATEIPNTKHHKRQRLDQYANRKSDEILHSVAERNLPRCSDSDREQDDNNKQRTERSAHTKNRSGPRRRSMRKSAARRPDAPSRTAA
jgi:hypothetical protein